MNELTNQNETVQDIRNTFIDFKKHVKEQVKVALGENIKKLTERQLLEVEVGTMIRVVSASEYLTNIPLDIKTKMIKSLYPELEEKK